MKEEELHFYPRPPLDETHRRNIAAAKIMDDNDAAKLWEYISENFKEAARWASIPEEEPDEFDLEMLEEIKHDPDCHVFISSDELKRSFGMPV